MMMIIGIDVIAGALAALCGWPELARQFDHPEWFGLSFYDTVFPLFLFIAGVSFPFSYAKQVEKGVSAKAIHLKILKRFLVLFLLGLVTNAIYMLQQFVDFDFVSRFFLGGAAGFLSKEAGYVAAQGVGGLIWPSAGDAITKDEGYEAGLTALAEQMVRAKRKTVVTAVCSGTNSAAAIEYVRMAERVARRTRARMAILARPPDDATNQTMMVDHYRALARATTLPVIVQTFNGKSPQPAVTNLVKLMRSYPEASKTALEEWPTPIVFTDFQYGRTLYAGRKIAESDVKRSPVKDVFKDSMIPLEKVMSDSWDQKAGHPSWDESAVLIAVRGLRYFNVERGTYKMVGEKGDDEWVADSASPHCRVTVKLPRSRVGAIIDDLICTGPRR